MLEAFLAGAGILVPPLLAAVALYALSALVFRRFLTAVAAASGRNAPRVFTWLRAPANVLHEGSHALATLVSGYRVAELRFCFNDPAARGYCRPGARWAPWGAGPVRDLLSGLAPLAAGAAVLPALARWAGVEVPLLDRDTTAEGGLAALASALRSLDPTDPRAWGFVAGAVLLGAEAHPSGRDLRLAAPAVAVLGLLLGVAGAASTGLPAIAPPSAALLGGAAAAAGWLASGAALGATALLLALVPAAPVALIAWRVARG